MTETPAPIGLISAIPNETRHFGPAMQASRTVDLVGTTFTVGTVDGHAIVHAECGMGKVNAAVVASLLIGHFGARALVFSGVAGGVDPTLEVGDVVIGTRLIQHDYGMWEPAGFEAYQPGFLPLFLPTDRFGYTLPADLHETLRRSLFGFTPPELSAAATGGAARRPRLAFGTIVTGDAFVHAAEVRERLYGRFQAQAVEMEGAAIAQVGDRAGVPTVIVRCLSDLAGAQALGDFTAFLDDCGRIAAAVVRRTLPHI